MENIIPYHYDQLPIFGKKGYFMKTSIFTGAATALITPFRNREVDYEALAQLIDEQLKAGIDALVICGTTGEASTLTDDEQISVIEFAVKRVAGRVPVIAGAGSNDTEHAIRLCQRSCEVGADALLIVTPYYNKTSQRGLIHMYIRIADNVTKPIILYNVPSRTGCNLLPETVAKLAEHPRIVAIKEASGNISQIAELAAVAGDKIDIYSGNDDQIIPTLSLGGIGVISVLSNLMPAETSAMCKKYLAGEHKEALKLQLDLLPLINNLFTEVNPIPVKAAMSAMGYGENSLRLPLTPMDEAKEAVLLGIMKGHGLI